MLIDITPKASEVKRIQLSRIRKNIFYAFSISVMLPIIIFIGLSFILFPYSRSLIEPVALVSAGHYSGSAFLIGNTKKLITARHVISNLKIGDNVTLTFTNLKSPVTTKASILWYEPINYPDTDPRTLLNDVAVLSLIKPSDLPADLLGLALGSSKGVKILQNVILIGYPAGEFMITSGKIGSLNYRGNDVFKLDANAWPGNSGGPLIDAESETVIGIINAKMPPPFNGITIATKLDYVLKLCNNNGINLKK